MGSIRRLIRRLLDFLNLKSAFPAWLMIKTVAPFLALLVLRSPASPVAGADYLAYGALLLFMSAASLFDESRRTEGKLLKDNSIYLWTHLVLLAAFFGAAFTRIDGVDMVYSMYY